MGQVARHRVEDAYRRIHDRLWHALLAFTGDPHLASDAEAEAFSQAIRRGDVLEDVDAWVWSSAFRIAGGLLQDRIRIDGHGTALDGLASEDVSLVEFVSQLSDLSPQQRAVVVLRYVGGFRPAEIAELLHSTPGSVRVQLHRAHAQLRVALESSDGR